MEEEKKESKIVYVIHELDIEFADRSVIGVCSSVEKTKDLIK